MTEPMRYLSPRLIDYVAVVGCPDPTADEGCPQLPQLLRRYPADDHADFALPPDTAFFCQPDGCLNVGRKQLSHHRESYSFVFALTEKDSGRRRYGTCLNFYRPFRRRVHGGSRHRTAAAPSRHGSSGAPAVALQAVQDGQQQPPHPAPREPPVPAARQLRTHTLTSLCIISHHGLFSTFRECLRILRRLINVCNAHLNSCQKTARVPKNTVWNFLVGKLAEVPPTALPLIRELETFILRLLSVPVPTPGKMRLELHLLPPEVSSPPLVIALPDHTRFSLVDFPLHLPLELLGVEQCIRVLECIMLEQKVLLQSHDHNALSMSVMALIVMLYPLEYMFPVIPLLPSCMDSAEQLLLAPTPFVIGVPAAFFQQRQGFTVPDDVWVVDLDSNTVRTPSAKGCELPLLPEPEVSQLRTYLKQSLSCLSIATQQPVKNLDALLELPSSQVLKRKPSEMGLSYNPFVFGNDVDSVDIATRVALVHFLCSSNVLANFQEHVRVLRLYPRPVVAFQLNSFLRSRPGLSAFTDRLARTQAIEFFAEWALNPTNVVFMRVLTGVYDPTVVGDKLRWYAHHLQPTVCSLLSSGSPFASLLTAGKDTVEDLTDESGESEEEPLPSRIVSNGSPNVPLVKSRAQSAEGSMQLMTVLEREVFSPPTHIPSISVGDSGSRGCRSSLEDRSDSEDSGQSDRETQSDSENGQAGKDNSDMPNLPKQKVREAGKKPHRPPAIAPSARKRNLSAPSTKISEQADSRVPLSPSALLSHLGNDIGSYAMSASSKLSGFLDTMGDKIQTSGGEHRLPVARASGGSSSAAVDATAAAAAVITGAAISTSRIVGSSPPMPGTTAAPAAGGKAVRGSAGDSAAGLVASASPGQPTLGAVDPAASDSAIAPLTSIATGGERQGLVRQATYSREVRELQRLHIDHPRVGPSAGSEHGVHGENQVFLKETISRVMEGGGIGWMKTGRIRKLMEDENYRNFVLSRLNGHLDKKLSSNDNQVVEDVQLPKNVFKGMLTLLKAIVSGLEHTWKTDGRGGVASALMVLEIAHTHYFLLDHGTSTSRSTNSSRSSSPYGSHESLASVTSTPAPASRRSSRKASHMEEPAAPSTAPKEDANESITTNGRGEQVEQQQPCQQPVAAPRRSVAGKAEMDLRLAGAGAAAVDSGTVGVSGANGPPSRMNSPGRSPISHQSLRKVAADRGSSPEAIANFSKSVIAADLIKKSQLSSGFRYLDGSLLNVSQSSSVAGSGVAEGVAAVKIYLFEGLLGKSRSTLWDQMQFWEDVFLDAVAQEREMIGLDQEPAELIERYVYLGEYERRRLEQEEDRLLASMLYNHAAFMLMMGCDKNEARKKIRRLLGRSHIGLLQSQLVNGLLDHFDQLSGNDVDLKPLPSRMVQKQSFSVHLGTDNTGEMQFMEVCDDCIILRCVSGAIVDRWWYEKVVNMTYCPKTRVLCLWRRDSEQTTQLNKFYTKKCRDLYACVKDAMEKAASRQQEKIPGPELGGEFSPVIDMATGKSGMLRVCMEGVAFTQDDYELFVKLDRIKKCFAQKGGMFILEELDPDAGTIFQRKYMSNVADQICYAVLCVFSYVAAGMEQAKTSGFNDAVEGDHHAVSDRSVPA